MLISHTGRKITKDVTFMAWKTFHSTENLKNFQQLLFSNQFFFNHKTLRGLAYPQIVLILLKMEGRLQ